MADVRDMRAALDASKLRLTPVEEQIILSGFSEIEKRLLDYSSNEDGRKEAKEPYEFS